MPASATCSSVPRRDAESDALAHVIERLLRTGLQAEEQLPHSHLVQSTADVRVVPGLESRIADEPRAHVGIGLQLVGEAEQETGGQRLVGQLEMARAVSAMQRGDVTGDERGIPPSIGLIGDGVDERYVAELAPVVVAALAEEDRQHRHGTQVLIEWEPIEVRCR